MTINRDIHLIHFQKIYWSFKLISIGSRLNINQLKLKFFVNKYIERENLLISQIVILIFKYSLLLSVSMKQFVNIGNIYHSLSDH